MTGFGRHGGTFYRDVSDFKSALSGGTFDTGVLVYMVSFPRFSTTKHAAGSRDFPKAVSNQSCASKTVDHGTRAFRYLGDSLKKFKSNSRQGKAQDEKRPYITVGGQAMWANIWCAVLAGSGHHHR